eukprot:gene11266-18893_t
MFLALSGACISNRALCCWPLRQAERSTGSSDLLCVHPVYGSRVLNLKEIGALPAQPRKFGTLDGVHVQAGWKVPARCHAEVSSSSTGGTAPPVAPAPIDELSSDKIQQLEVYLDFLLETNKVMNLTAVTDRSEAWERHIIDSLALMPVLDLHVAKTLRPATTKSRGDTKKGPSKKQVQHLNE